MADLQFDIVIAGGSLGGVAGALSAAATGASVCLIEASKWVGGQSTSQGCTRADETTYTAGAGSTASYRRFRDAVRHVYTTTYTLAHPPAPDDFNPGGHFATFRFAPQVGHDVLMAQLRAPKPAVDVRLETTVISAESDGDVVHAIVARGKDGTTNRFVAKIFLDATDLGDLLPLCKVPFRIGAESRGEFGEPAAPTVAHPEWIQPITMPIALELGDPADPPVLVPKPANYDAIANEQRFRLIDGDIKTVFAEPYPGADTLWNYRQFVDASQFNDKRLPHSLTTLNVGSNDYKTASLPTGTAAGDADVIARAREVSVAYVYWLQNVCERDGAKPGDKTGYPNVRVRADVFGTPDGTSPMPYIRESRRIEAMTTVCQQDIDADINAATVRAKPFADSCGIGWYAMDIHAANNGLPWSQHGTKPFQIPLGALVPQRMTNLLAACKNIGVTHITNGAYRVHPVEWNIGESAGALAAFCIARGVAARSVVQSRTLLRAFQRVLLGIGVPLYWWTDVMPSDKDVFVAAHLLGVDQVDDGGNRPEMKFRPADNLTKDEKARFDRIDAGSYTWPAVTMKRGAAAVFLASKLS